MRPMLTTSLVHNAAATRFEGAAAGSVCSMLAEGGRPWRRTFEASPVAMQGADPRRERCYGIVALDTPYTPRRLTRTTTHEEKDDQTTQSDCWICQRI